MGFTLNPFRKPVYDDVAAPVPDLQAAVDFAMLFAFATGGTATARNDLLPGQRRDGMIWIETDTGYIWRDVAGNWTLLSPATLSVMRAATQTLTNGVYADVLFTGQTPLLSGSGLSLNAATGVVTVGHSALYRIHGSVTFAAGGTAGTEGLAISVNGSTTPSKLATTVTNVQQEVSVEAILQLNANDTVKLRAIQNSGANKNIGAASGGYDQLLIVERRPAA
ncbi:hypothetical protein [Microbacterium sp.]|uniref:hypothetical protein n=1 Tax=Microbacterium sp. TaxID=51671 RepID=UPI003F7204BF